MSEATPRRCRFGLFDFDPASGELRREGDPVKLAPQPTRVLALLLSRAGEVVLRDELRREIWGDDTFVDFERSLNFCIQQVRSALGDSSDNPRFVQTVPRRGYRFIAPVSATASAAAIPALATPARESPSSAAVAQRPGGAWVRAAAVAAILLAAAAWLLWSPGPRTTASMTAASRGTRIVVLPFANLTGDEAAGPLADGLTDELIAQLGTLGRDHLAVIARTSAMSYRNTSKTVAAIGTELGTQYVVEGTVRREGGVLRVTSNLVPVESQTPLARWEETFDSRSTSPDTQQTYAAIRLARLVALKLMAPGDAAPPARTTLDPAAWEAFLQAASAMQRGTAADVRGAIAYLETAVQHDETFAAAWAQLAQARHTLVMMGGAPPADAYPAAKSAAARAVALDRDLADAHIAEGLVDLWYRWKPADAARAFERALSLNASSATAHHDYAWALAALGRTDEAVRHMITARDLDPISTRANNDVGWLHLHLRNPAEAARACQHTLAIEAQSLEAQACLERAYADRHLLEAALQAARMATPPDAALTGTGSAGAGEALQQLWRWRVQRMEQASRTRWVSPYMMAVHYTLIGETAKALTALEKGYAEHAGMLVLLARDPAVDALRAEPRFQSLLEKLSAIAQ